MIVLTLLTCHFILLLVSSFPLDSRDCDVEILDMYWNDTSKDTILVNAYLAYGSVQYAYPQFKVYYDSSYFGQSYGTNTITNTSSLFAVLSNASFVQGNPHASVTAHLWAGANPTKQCSFTKSGGLFVKGSPMYKPCPVSIADLSLSEDGQSLILIANRTDSQAHIDLMQYPGWRVYYNNKLIGEHEVFYYGIGSGETEFEIQLLNNSNVTWEADQVYNFRIQLWQLYYDAWSCAFQWTGTVINGPTTTTMVPTMLSSLSSTTIVNTTVKATEANTTTATDGLPLCTDDVDTTSCKDETCRCEDDYECSTDGKCVESLESGVLYWTSCFAGITAMAMSSLVVF